MKVRIERDKCGGHNNCVSIAPNVFDLDDEFKAVVVDPKADSEEDVLKAAKMCPKLAIVIDDESGARVFPTPDAKPRDQLNVSE